MKKKVVAMLMTAVMVITMAACGDEAAEGSTPADTTVEQSGEETFGTEDTEGSEETKSEGEDQEEGSEEPSDSQESQAGDAGEESSEAADAVVFPDNYDWASVDWEREIIRHPVNGGSAIDSDGTVHDDYTSTYAKELVVYAMDLPKFGMTPEEYFEIMVLDMTYDELDEESKTILSKLQELSDEELSIVVSVVYPVPDNYDWASVDWMKEIGTMYSGDPMRVKQLFAAASLSQVQIREVEEFINENYMDYDSLDEESKAILDKLMEVSYDELMNIQYNFLW